MTIKSSAKNIIITTLIFSIGYAILRYHIAGGVPWSDFPFFILNKGFSLSAFILISLNFSFGPAKQLNLPIPERWLLARKTIGMTGFILVLIHALMSLMIFSPDVYGNFFKENGHLTAIAGISMLAGILAFAVLWVYNLSFQTYLREDKAFITFITSRKFLLWAHLLGGLHLGFMGYSGWLNPAGWHGGLPPISLIAFSFFTMAYVMNLFGKE